MAALALDNKGVPFFLTPGINLLWALSKLGNEHKNLEESLSPEIVAGVWLLVALIGSRSPQ